MKMSTEQQKLYIAGLEERSAKQAIALVHVADACRHAIDTESPHSDFASRVLYIIEQDMGRK